MPKKAIMKVIVIRVKSVMTANNPLLIIGESFILSIEIKYHL